MEKLNALEKWSQEVVASWPATTKLGSFNHRLVRDVAEEFRALERTSDTNMAAAQAMRDDMRHWKQRAEAADAALERESDIHIDTAESMREWRLRAEAAEAKLAESEKQKPVAWHVYQWRETPKGWDWYLTRAFASEPINGDGWRSAPLFTRPAPAVSLAELVPKEVSIRQAIAALENHEWCSTPASGYKAGVKDAISAILRNIEEAK